jgi:hypothetical protein
MPDGGDKICVVCGKSCAGQPRQKDAQGRYAHTACLPAASGASRQAAARGTAPQPRTPQGDDGQADIVLAGLPEQSAMVPCPGCGVLHGAEEVVCVRCGFNVATGRSMRTRTTTEKAKSERAPIRIPGMGSAMAVVGCSLGIGGLLLMWGMLGGGDLSNLIALSVVVGVLALVAYAGAVVCAFLDGRWIWGWVNIAGLLVFGSLPNLIWVWFFSGRNWLRVCSASSLIGTVGLFFAASSLSQRIERDGYGGGGGLSAQQDRPDASYSARRLALEGEDPRQLDVLLKAIGDIIIVEGVNSQARARMAFRQITEAETVDDYPQELFDVIVARLNRLTPEERRAMLLWAETQSKSIEEQDALLEDPKLGPLVQAGGAKLNQP